MYVNYPVFLGVGLDEVCIEHKQSTQIQQINRAENGITIPVAEKIPRISRVSSVR